MTRKVIYPSYCRIRVKRLLRSPIENIHISKVLFFKKFHVLSMYARSSEPVCSAKLSSLRLAPCLCFLRENIALCRSALIIPEGKDRICITFLSDCFDIEVHLVILISLSHLYYWNSFEMRRMTKKTAMGSLNDRYRQRRHFDQRISHNRSYNPSMKTSPVVRDE